MSSENSETRTRILKAAWPLLEASRGRGVKMGDIASAAGVSRQAVYLHFATRADLLIATTHYVDEVNDVAGRLVASRTAASGRDRLAAYVDAWGNYIPEIYGVAKALIAVQDTDEAARLAWGDRLAAIREGFHAAAVALESDGVLARDFTVEEATDILWSLLSVQTWELLRLGCGWSQSDYIARVKRLAEKMLIEDPS